VVLNRYVTYDKIRKIQIEIRDVLPVATAISSLETHAIMPLVNKSEELRKMTSGSLSGLK
jgi:hypothetical protein